MKENLWLVSFLGAMAVAWQVAKGDDTKAARHEVFDGYFVSNKFEPDAAESFVAISGQKKFDEVFGVAFVMGDKAHRLPKDAFSRTIVFAVVKRGMALWDFKVSEVVDNEGKLEIRYTAKSSPQPTATYACPLIVGVPKKAYKSVTFVEDKKPVKTLKINKE